MLGSWHNTSSFYKLKNNMQNIYKNDGLRWIEGLTVSVDFLKIHWNLSNIFPVDNMSFHFVAKANQMDKPVILKLGIDKKATENEINALQHLNKEFIIKLLDYNPEHNAMLLSQAVPGLSLKTFYPAQINLVMDVYCDVVSNLHHQSSNPPFPHVKQWLVAIDHADKNQLPAKLLEQAILIKNKLLTTMVNQVVLHGDLHHDNILQHENSWKVIDPKGVIGEKEFEFAAFDFVHPSELKNQEIKNILQKRIKLLAAKSKLDPERLKHWVFVRLILSAAWSIEDNDDASVAIQLAEMLSG